MYFTLQKTFIALNTYNNMHINAYCGGGKDCIIQKSKHFVMLTHLFLKISAILLK